MPVRAFLTGSSFSPCSHGNLVPKSLLRCSHTRHRRPLSVKETAPVKHGTEYRAWLCDQCVRCTGQARAEAPILDGVSWLSKVVACCGCRLGCRIAVGCSLEADVLAFTRRSRGKILAPYCSVFFFLHCGGSPVLASPQSRERYAPTAGEYTQRWKKLKRVEFCLCDCSYQTCPLRTFRRFLVLRPSHGRVLGVR